MKRNHNILVFTDSRDSYRRLPRCVHIPNPYAADLHTSLCGKSLNPDVDEWDDYYRFLDDYTGNSAIDIVCKVCVKHIDPLDIAASLQV